MGSCRHLSRNWPTKSTGLTATKKEGRTNLILYFLIMVVRPSTQQAVDRIVGTAVILGISIAAFRWLSNSSKRRQVPLLPWWLIALRRRNDRRARTHHEGCVESEQWRAREKNMESGYEHRGSCHCRSIQFLVSICAHRHNNCFK